MSEADTMPPLRDCESPVIRMTCIGAGSRSWCGNCLHYLENAPEDGTEHGGRLDPFLCQIPSENGRGRLWSQYAPLIGDDGDA